MSDPFAWPALAGGAALVGEQLHYAVGIWGKVHGQPSDYRWIAHSSGFGSRLPDLHRRLRIGSEDLAVRTTAWRAPWEGLAERLDWFAVGTYPSRAQDAAGRSGVLEKQVLHWRRPAPGVPVALAACALLPLVARADDRPWWDRVGEGDWRRPDYALPLGPAACPAVTIRRAELEAVIAAGIDDLMAVLDQSRLAAVYAALLAGSHPAVLGGLERPLSPAALATLLLPLSPGQAERCSLCAWVPSTLIDPQDLARNWDLVVVRQPGLPPSVAAEYVDPGAALAAALYARDPGLIARADRGQGGWSADQEQCSEHPNQRASIIVPAIVPSSAETVRCIVEAPSWRSKRLEAAATMSAGPVAGIMIEANPRMHLEPAAAATWPGLRTLYTFADCIDLRRLDLGCLAQDLTAPAAYPLLAPDADPAGHPLLDWIAVLDGARPAGVDAAEWAFKIDQLRAAALFLLPHPATLDLVGLPRSPQVPALLAVLAAEPGLAAGHLAAHGGPALRRMLEHSLACPAVSVVSDIRIWMQRWLAQSANTGLASALADLLGLDQDSDHLGSPGA